MVTPPIPVEHEESADTVDVLNALSDLGTLDQIGITKADIQSARHDSVHFEALRVTHELLMELREEDVLNLFFLLPDVEQSDFVRWAGATDSESLRMNRTETFIQAIKAAPPSLDLIT